jgi:hypothetical protein
MAKAKAQADAAPIVEEEKTTIEAENPVVEQPETDNKADKTSKKDKPMKMTIARKLQYIQQKLDKEKDKEKENKLCKT